LTPPTAQAPGRAPHLALVGPTASGKSTLALRVAQELGDLEIVSIDSMQVYRGMDIGTAKATAAERAAVPHHMIDVADPGEDFSVARFQLEARAAVRAIEERGHRALLVGGTGLYVQAVVDDLRFPGEDLTLRAELEARTAAAGGVAEAYAELERLDPAAAVKIDPHNARRIVRALEVIRITGERFSSFGAGVAAFGTTAFPVHLVGVWLPRAVLAARIEARVDAMRRAGFAEEVAALEAGPGLSRNARQAIGYRELLEHLAGATTLDEALGTTIRRTRSFARRQRMWFRRDPRVTWLAAAENPCDLGPALLALWSR
jgi:tRNA dimethylallyltransferase